MTSSHLYLLNADVEEEEERCLRGIILERGVQFSDNQLKKNSRCFEPAL